MNLNQLTANDSQLAQVHMSTVAESPAFGTRVLMVQPAGGIHARVLLDRGMDIGAAWFAGQPISWLSAVGEQKAGLGDAEEGWHRGWAGGLLTTCGLQNVGLPSEGFGRHGSYSDQSAENIRVRRDSNSDGEEEIVLEGTIHDHDGLSRGLVLNRRMAFLINTGRVTIRDKLANESAKDLQTPILYHVNFGYPFLNPESILDGEITKSVPNGRADVNFQMNRSMGLPRVEQDEVLEHDVISRDGVARLALTSPGLGMEAEVSWRVDELPRVHTWRCPRPGSYVHAIEPANCGVNGRESDREMGRAPILRAGSSRTTEISVIFRAI